MAVLAEGSNLHAVLKTGYILDIIAC